MSGLWSAGLRRFGEVAVSHVGPDQVPGLVALVALGDDQQVQVAGFAVDRRPTGTP